MVDKKSDGNINLSEKHGCARRFGLVFGMIHVFYERLIEVVGRLDYQYESDRKLFGWPVISVNLGLKPDEHTLRHARGIIAIGTKATGLFSIGLFCSTGLVAIGAVSFGLVAVSTFGAALVSVCVFGVGWISVSVFAVGYLAVGILAIGYKSIGIVAIGKEVVGIICFGKTVNSLFTYP